MLGHDAEEDEENPITMPEKIMKVGHDAGENEENPVMIPKKIMKVWA